MLAYVLLAVLAVIVVALLAWGAGRRPYGDETARFSRARDLTGEWSKGTGSAGPDVGERRDKPPAA